MLGLCVITLGVFSQVEFILVLGIIIFIMQVFN